MAAVLEKVTFFKSTDGSSFTRNVFWDMVPMGAYQSGPDTYEFSGRIHNFIGTRNLRTGFSLYDTSNDCFIPNGRADIFTRAYSGRFVEVSGVLYLITTSETSPYTNVYRYDHEENQFYKMSDSITLPAYAGGMNLITFSGTPYISYKVTNNTFPIKTATFDGSSLNLLADPSTLPTAHSNGHAPHFFEHNGKLFMVATNRNNQTSGDIGWYTYQLDGSSWIDVDPGPPENWVFSGSIHKLRHDQDPTYDFRFGRNEACVPFKIGSRQCLLVNFNTLPSPRS